MSFEHTLLLLDNTLLAFRQVSPFLVKWMEIKVHSFMAIYFVVIQEKVPVSGLCLIVQKQEGQNFNPTINGINCRETSCPYTYHA